MLQVITSLKRLGNPKNARLGRTCSIVAIVLSIPYLLRTLLYIRLVFEVWPKFSFLWNLLWVLSFRLFIILSTGTAFKSKFFRRFWNTYVIIYLCTDELKESVSQPEIPEKFHNSVVVACKLRSDCHSFLI